MTWSYQERVGRLVTGLSLLPHPARLGSAADRLETLAFDCFIQEEIEEFYVSCCLHREHSVKSGIRRRGLIVVGALQVTVVTVTVTVTVTV